MNLAQKNLCLLLRSALTGERLELPANLDVEAVFGEATRHGVVSMAYTGALNCGVDKSMPAMRRALNTYYSELMGSEKQLYSVKKICCEFEKAGISYMLLKGSHLKQLYPKPEMRKMNDADILIREIDYEKASEIVTRLGFVKDNRDSDHSRNFTSENLYLELHVRLVARDEIKVYANYLGDGWERARLCEGNRYEMSPEDEFIFLLIHFAKHYISGGVGCKHLCDLWIFLAKNANVDLDYVEAELKKIDLFDFYKNLTNSLRNIFENGAGDEKTEMILSFVLEYGQWGTATSYRIAKGLRSKNEVGNSKRVRAFTLWRTIFPPLSAMKKSYTVLEKHWYLLPVMWVARWVSVVVCRRDKITKKTKELELISSNNIDNYEECLRFVGINSSK